ncbi:hypothetical protein QNN03_18050 [Streptomyces sp. GXMU-J15]|uniref:Uncharacterized protein n=1 Tax=Streptomyces fuscus TaxID=3048495 RepID=A0ABT7J0G8_9ACTN|nr:MULTISPECIES: hypothetical protein [Streptomyces]MDL2078339.1 hypothetical protein [Streptomyces fuscus]SBT93807.1 hypothetical protein GA0115233_10724 [Streptomyces sp. DI166]
MKFDMGSTTLAELGKSTGGSVQDLGTHTYADYVMKKFAIDPLEGVTGADTTAAP